MFVESARNQRQALGQSGQPLRIGLGTGDKRKQAKVAAQGAQLFGLVQHGCPINGDTDLR